MEEREPPLRCRRGWRPSETPGEGPVGDSTDVFGHGRSSAWAFRRRSPGVVDLMEDGGDVTAIRPLLPEDFFEGKPRLGGNLLVAEADGL